jgi:hemerythrin-like domain-containing protein
MKSTQQLSHDHELISRGLDLLRSAGAGWRKYQEGAADDCRTLVEFMKTVTDCHHRKEERVFFPKLNQAGMSLDHGPLHVMLYEHDEAREFIRGMEQALQSTSPLRFVFYANRYADLLAEHIAKEDNVLFVRAAEILTAADDEAIWRRFEQIEHEMGEDAHDKFDEMLDTLALRYLPKAVNAA